MKTAMKQSTLTKLLNFGTIVAILLAVFSSIGIMNATADVRRANEDRYRLTHSAVRFANASKYLTAEVRGYVITTDKSHYNNYWNEVNNLKNRDAAMADMRAIGITPQEEERFNAAMALSNELVPLEESAMKYIDQGMQKEAIGAVYKPEYAQRSEEILAIQDEVQGMLEVRLNDEVAALQRRLVLLWTLTLSVFALVVVSQIISYLFLRKKVIAPVIAIQNQMMEIAAGNLSAPFALEADTSEIGMLVHSIHSTKETLRQYIADISSKLGEMANNNMAIHIDVDYIGDFAPMKQALTQIVSSLSGALHRIHVSAEQVASGSGQVSSAAQALSQGATEQASAIEELSATISEISTHVKHSADSAQDASKQVINAEDEVENSNKKMQEMIVAINEISKKSNQIGNIIKTIEDIAFQTNILALNAAVEAARAGTAGKGFAVVADEVRNLAGKSAVAAKNTTALIEETIQAVAHGNRLAEETATSMNTVVQGTRSVTELVDAIAKQSSEQAEAIMQVTQGVDQISAVIQMNSATAEESAAASEQLNGQSQLLKDLVGQFKLSEVDANSYLYL